MMIVFLRNNKVAMWVLTVLRVWLGYNWAVDGFEKVTAKGGFHADGMIMAALKAPVMTPAKTKAFPWYDTFLQLTTGNGKSHAALNAFSFAVSWGELLVGLGLIFGTLTLAAAFFGLLMNFSYLGAGVVSVNPTYIFIEFMILIGGYNSARIGFDRWVTPFLRSKFAFLNNDIEVK